jgi:hypothetical protein
MDILRVPPYNLTAMIDVALPATEYDYQIIDMADSSVIDGSVTSDINRKVLIPLPTKYDGDYEIIIDGEETQVTVIRPYSNPNEHGSTASEIASYTSHEELARAIIDSVNDVEFTYRKKVLEVVGLGLDYIPLWVDAKKILKVYENNVLVYDAENPDDYATGYEITADGTAITMSYPDAVNRDESARLLLPASPTDIVEFNYAPRGFPKGWDYKIVVEAGFKKVPGDIKRAAELLIHDIDCGKLDYYKRYIGSYNTDQFRIQFDKAVFEGTGNLIVDKILLKYEKSIKFVGVL